MQLKEECKHLMAPEYLLFSQNQSLLVQLHSHNFLQANQGQPNQHLHHCQSFQSPMSTENFKSKKVFHSNRPEVAKELLKTHEKDEDFIALCILKNAKLWTYEIRIFDINYGISTKQLSEKLSQLDVE